ncbi:hypothetical protein [Rubinisphaera margarita]|uniref:hypothetical protein n=1 Tax=Rubinisphaera margarita TaxID=2909586 RepID=UPI001EE7F3D9|nr:hypothetical protein [Rubinisphaera margarita]MCG6158567.1 hypothetical protein [Rubinisphaera margarita]
MIQLTQEQRDALSRSHDRIEFEDPITKKVYVLAERDLWLRSPAPLAENADLVTIQREIRELEAGEGMGFDELRKELYTEMREEFGLPLPEIE